MNTQTRFCFLALSILLTLTACGASQDAPTLVPATKTSVPPTATMIPFAVVVNGEIISLEEFNAELLRFQDAQTALGKSVSLAEAEERVLNDLIDQRLLAQGARTAGYTLEDAEVEARFATLAEDVGGEENLSGWLASHHYTRETFIQSLRRAIESAWMRDDILASLPSTAEEVHAQQILLYNREKAEDVQSQLSAGADFGELASAYDPKTNGELFWFPRGYLLEPSIEEAAFSLAIGEPSEIIETEVGFHIIMVLDREAKHPLSPDALLTLQENALKNWLQKAREASKIER